MASQDYLMPFPRYVGVVTEVQMVMLLNACFLGLDELNCLGVVLQPLKIIKDYMNFCIVELRIQSNKLLQQKGGSSTCWSVRAKVFYE